MKNSSELIQMVLDLRKVDVPYETVAKVVNEKYELYGEDAKTAEACRHIYRKHNDSVTKKSNFQMKGRFGEHVPINLENESYLVIPDLHMPFMKHGFLEFLVRTRDNYGLEKVFGIGDALDHHALSFWDNDESAEDAKNEHQKAKDQIDALAEHFPNIAWTVGNHDIRHLRLAAKQGIPQVYLRTINEIFEMPDGWKWHKSYVINGSTLIEHGTSSGFRATYDRAWGTSKNVVQGHTHNYGGVLYMNDGFNVRWALNVGCGIDPQSYALAYAENNKFKPTLGCGVVLNGIPHFIPFNG